jgi:phosphoglycerol geranylgeranyltransferase
MKFTKLTQQLQGKRALLAVLIDPDKFNPELVKLASEYPVSCFLVGGSRIEHGQFKDCIAQIKKLSQLPLIIFPGDETQLSSKADGLLLLSLLSGRNPDYLIGKHIQAAPVIKSMHLPVLSTAYLIINKGKESSTEIVTGTSGMDPSNRSKILATVQAAEMIGFKAIYLEAGSGAGSPVPKKLIQAVKKETMLPVIVGGGINSKKRVEAAIEGGANLVVIGNALEKNVHLLTEISTCFKRSR